MKPEPKQYTCARCGKTFWSERTDEETLKEFRENFGDIPLEETVVICDDCYQAVTVGGKPIQWN